MRQGEVAPQGKWSGQPLGGVTAPEPLILPDPARRFANTAKRLETLATGHPMEEWLHFMAVLAQAQHDAAVTLPPPSGVEPSLVEQVVKARMPPLAPDGHRRDPRWQDGLAHILRRFDGDLLPDQAMSVIADLRCREPRAIEALANDVLRSEISPNDVGQAVYVGAALQVYFTRMAAGLVAGNLRLLPQRGLCPCCGSTPVTGLVTASGPIPGMRYLHCSLCSAAWNHVRAVCVTCGGSRTVSLAGIEGDSGAVKAETCGDCRSYAKMLYQAKDMQVDPFADDLATLALDVLLAEESWSRHAPNPLLVLA
jgi:FdhE protein